MAQEMIIRFSTSPILRARCLKHDVLLHGQVKWDSIWGEGDQPKHAYMVRPGLENMRCPGEEKFDGVEQTCAAEWKFELVSQTRRIDEMHVY